MGMRRETPEEYEARQERHKNDFAAEQATDAWYVTLLGCLTGWNSAFTQAAREKARRRHQALHG